MTATDVWIRIVSQVVVVGAADPASRLADPAIRKRLNYDALSLMSDSQAAETIGDVLREIKTRYVPRENPAGCRKTKALVKNLNFLMGYPGGPKGLLKDVAALPTSDDRWRFIDTRFAFIRDKGARDLLTTGFGLVTDRIALDSRVMGIVSQIVPSIPNKVPKERYAEIEAFLAKEVCVPLKITPAHLDQLLFLYQPQILAGLESMPDATDFSGLSTESLLKRYCEILTELKRREVVRTGNSPTGDYAEWLAAQKLGLILQPNSSKGYDAVDATGVRYQIKSRRVSTDAKSIQLSPIRNMEAKDFDDLIVIVFNEDFEVQEALRVPHRVAASTASRRDHVNGHVLLVRDSLRRQAGVIDITDKFL